METNNSWTQPYRDSVSQQLGDSEEVRQDFDPFFTRLNAFAATCSDQADFINKFTTGELFNEYNALMAKHQEKRQQALSKEIVNKTIKETMSPKNIASNMAKQEAHAAASRAVSEVLPDEVNAVRWGGYHAIPVIGPIIGWISNIRWLSRLFRKN